MEIWYENLISALPMYLLLVVITVLIFLLGKGADMLVDEAVTLSIHWGVPKMLVGATIVSLGTTLPEASVSVFAAVQGSPGLALGNVVGSVICDTGLILGLAALLAPLPLIPSVVQRQGWIQQGAGLLLIIACLPFAHWQNPFIHGGRLPQWVGILFLLLLVVYMWGSVHWARRDKKGDREFTAEMHEKKSGLAMVVLKLIAGIVLVVVSSRFLIPAVQEFALRLSVPESIVAATLVAFGTSLPELVTALTAVRKGHGGLAVGNIIGADILNVLFVGGAAAAVTAGGLKAPASFFRMLFPAMLAILIIFRLGIHFSKDTMKRPFGILLLLVYVVITMLSYGQRSLE